VDLEAGGSSTSRNCTSVLISWCRILPDLAGWRRQRMPELPDAAYFELAPDWVCDTFARSECGPPAAGPKGDPHGRGEKIISPSTASKDRVIKMPLYARKQVQHLWLVDPDLRALEVYELREGHWSLQASLKDDDGVRQPPFEACEFDLGSLWA
jgi:hypothetical protein